MGLINPSLPPEPQVPNNPDLSLTHNSLHVSTRLVNLCPDPVYGRFSRVLLREFFSSGGDRFFPDLVSTR
jgi:hypothetical protein